ncbi:hypothetical protein ACZ11_23510 [Lysinibacillus xylanilyticus]|uniref:Uncharacterized protein n=1 Tax=Lysinibacillus xylanilyticus TaxID=582475 RepID=A0A0K9F1T8_9BACI|nr:hypothetical protein ACZ11_23510 [Lysinibacillus xylanilyticus]
MSDKTRKLVDKFQKLGDKMRKLVDKFQKLGDKTKKLGVILLKRMSCHPLVWPESHTLISLLRLFPPKKHCAQ